MQSGRSTLPEFDGRWNQAIAAPERRQRNIGITESLLDFSKSLNEKISVRNDFALFGNPSANLRFPRAGMEIPEGFFAGCFFDGSLDDHLALKRDPREKKAGFGVR